MLKLLPVVLIIAVIIGAGIYFILFHRPGISPNDVTLSGFEKTTQPASVDSLEQRIQDLEKVINTLTLEGKIASPSSSISTVTYSPTDTTNINSRITSLEQAMVVLQNRVSKLESPSPSTQSQASKYPIYIPLGSSGQSGDKNWNTTGTYQVTIDTTKYSGYTSMQLEVNTQMINSNGQGNFRLFNLTDNSAVSNSTASTTSTNYTWISSGEFTISSGTKTYVLQIQSTQGANININNARIKVNF